MAKLDLNRDIQSPALLKIKGLLFAVIGFMSTGLLIWKLWDLAMILVLGVTIWAWCRFYYFLFYVLEHYAGRKRPYAGIIDALMSVFRSEPENPDSE